MSSFNDGHCLKCKRRIGWTGKLTDKPACPSCGHKPTDRELKELANEQEIMDDYAELLLAKKKCGCVMFIPAWDGKCTICGKEK